MSYFVTLAFVLFVHMNIWFLVSLLKKRNDIADVAWGLGFVLLAWVSILISGSNGFKNVFTAVLVTIWGSRLAFHIYQRNKGKTEDYRYLAWRKQWGKWFYLRSYFQVYVLQGALLFIIVLPILFININTVAQFRPIDAIAFFVWTFGFFFEVMGDWQLAEFIKNPKNKGRLMTSGLWQYTRHPNYFGEVVLWWGIWLLAFSLQYGWFTIIGPLTITLLILKVSGVPMLEKKMIEHPDFARYKEKTNVFFPWFRKHTS